MKSDLLDHHTVHGFRMHANNCLHRPLSRPHNPLNMRNRTSNLALLLLVAVVLSSAAAAAAGSSDDQQTCSNTDTAEMPSDKAKAFVQGKLTTKKVVVFR